MKKRDIILMNTPFTDLSETKIRPALVLSRVQDDLLICFISSKIKKGNQYELALSPDTLNNLRANSVIKYTKIFTLHHTLAKGVLGHVTPAVYQKVIKGINNLFK